MKLITATTNHSTPSSLKHNGIFFTRAKKAEEIKLKRGKKKKNQTVNLDLDHADQDHDYQERSQATMAFCLSEISDSNF